MDSFRNRMLLLCIALISLVQAQEKGVCVQPIDLVFALDASGSVEEEGYSQIKQFTKELVNGFEISADKTHVGVLIFSEYAQIEIKLTDTFDKDVLKEKIDKLSYPGYRTATDDALRVANTGMFSLAGGIRQGIPQVLIFLTDGKCSVCKEPLEDAVRPLKERGINIYTIGVTNSINRTELEIISSEPVQDHMYEVQNFNQLKSLVTSLQKRSCAVKKGKCSQLLPPFFCTGREEPECFGDDQCPGTKKCCSNGCTKKCEWPLLNCLTPLDVAFALDSSSSVTEQTYGQMKRFAEEIVNSFAVSQHEARFATLIYSEQAEVGFNFVRFDSVNEVKKAIRGLKHLKDATRVDRALEIAKSDLFSLQGKVRTRRPMVLVVFFDGDVSRDMKDLKEVTAPLKDYGVKVVAIGVGPEVNKYQLNKVASSEDSIFQGETFADVLPELYSIAKEACTTKPGTCEAHEEPTTPGACDNVIDDCEHDFDCYGTAKCCKKGCKKTCVVPASVCKRKVDIAFVIHQNLEEGEFNRVQDFVKSSVDHFEVGVDKTHVALLTFGQNPKVVLDFNNGQDFNGNVKKEIDALKYNPGMGKISDVLALSCDSIFCTAGGTRDNVPKMMVLITGKSSPSPRQDLKARLGTLRARGVDVIVIGIGDVDAGLLQEMTSNDPNVENRVWLTKYASGVLQYGQDVADFACGEAGSTPPPAGGNKVPTGGCNNKPKTCVKGPKGSRGRSGKVGPIGEPGITGLQGPKGIKGPKGTKGPNGNMGPKGDRGDEGLIGLPGFPGYHGIPGVPGVEGRTGRDGDCGLPGKSGDGGPAGLNGFNGPPGRRGEAGQKGTKGPDAPDNPDLKIEPGANGDPGEDSPIGIKGEKGSEGTKGPVGEDGGDGLNGSDGLKGEMGDLGTFNKVRGEKGRRGDVGRPGPQWSKGGKGGPGIRGPQGENGTAGETGQKGEHGQNSTERGIDGQKGLQGPQGSAGDNGAAGPVGQKGPAGGTGVQGMKGEPGDVGRDGRRGVTGPGGERGLTGSDGKKGELGDDGALIPGEQGESGANGEKGLPGREGLVGGIGPSGSDGKQGGVQIGPGGDPGAVGPRGSRGKNGIAGAPGMEGVIGPKGPKGDDGERGNPGKNAELRPGKPGMDGPPGGVGPVGPVGDTGLPGTKGEDVVLSCVENVCPKGVKGQKGPPGNTGKPGAFGPLGTTGLKGHPGGPCPTCPAGQQGISGEIGGPGMPGKDGSNGVQGDQGDAGKQGRQGPDGPVGVAGGKGIKGVKGDVGSGGIVGEDSPGELPGRKGEKGLNGEDGADGSRGRKGRAGLKGMPGSDGAEGKRGRQGAKGTTGPTGPIGVDGKSGRTGPVGEAGEGQRGPRGEVGNLGRQGVQGGIGETGSDGEKGAVGSAPTEAEMKEMKNKMAGVRGEKGPSGEDGEIGNSGPDGFDGPRGPQGERGAAGSKGFGGITGDVGVKGKAGDDGDPGQGGVPGINGKTGEPGENGKTGPPGVALRGSKGPTGDAGADGKRGTDAPPPLGCFQVDVTDIAFLLDSSRSVSANDFDRQLNFTRDILGQFDIGPRQTQAGIIKYGKTADVQIDFDQYATDVELFNAVRKIKYSEDRESRLDLALKVAKEELFTTERGAREKVGDQIVGKAIVILGDGYISGGGISGRTHYRNAIKYATELKDLGVNVFAIGVGAERNKILLQNLVTQTSYYLEIENYSQLLSAVGNFRESFVDESCTSEGDPGRDGITGDKGEDGDPGRKGASGFGPKGPSGSKGSRGQKGVPGFGDSGLPGDSGLMGVPGDQGKQGRPGRDIVGPPGSKGEIGGAGDSVRGPKGNQGEDGIKGDKGPDAVKKICDYALATDIVFLLDSSNSVGISNFNKMKSFIQAIVKSFDVDNQLTRVSVITFDENAKLLIRLNDYNRLELLNKAIQDLPYARGEATRMDKALLLAKSEAFTEGNGARAGVRRALVLMADGQQSFALDLVPLETAVKPLVNDKVLRYAIGIGREIAATELKTIAGDNVVLADNFDELQLKINDQIGLIGRGGCKGEQGPLGKNGGPGRDGFPGPQGPPGPRGAAGEDGTAGVKGVKGEQGVNVGSGRKGEQGDPGTGGPTGLPGCEEGNGQNVATDLGFMLDASGSLYASGYQSEKEFVKYVIDKVGPISSSGLRVGVLVYSDVATLRIRFDEYFNAGDLKYAIDQLPYDKKGTRMDLGLRKAKELFATENGGRGNSKKVLILLTDGQQTYVPGVSEPSDIAKELAADGIDIFAIGIGQEIDQAELKTLISKPEHIFLAEDINSLIVDLSGDISKALTCEGGPRGPEGRSGDDGPPGAVGALGDIGDLGPKGYRGDPGFGPKGEPGPDGLPGSSADIGDKGFRGPTGIVGERGLRGSTGHPGPPGLKGEVGLDGFIGNDGPDGPPGPKGQKGSTAGDGRPGDRGERGDAGVNGPRGDAGRLPPGSNMKDIKGDKGPQGNEGNTGMKGNNGTLLIAPGPFGLTGQKGEPGPSGDFGPTGGIGPTGPAGIKGEPGSNGAKGRSGTFGFPGFKGFKGAIGEQGADGIGRKGEPGVRGSNGRDGPLGFQGDEGISGFFGMDGKKGDQGDAGPKGRQQEPSAPDTTQKGYKGDPGIDGDFGNPGPIGEPGIRLGGQGEGGEIGERGIDGPPGPKGPVGKRGMIGETGRQGPTGRTGSDGNPGSQGTRGRTGERGETIGGSEKGDIGLDGPRGPKGRPGLKGRRGSGGPKGRPGIKGIQGPRGSNGFPGLQGDQGPDGGKGGVGPKGNLGGKGNPGPAGPSGASGIAEGFYIVRHSQDSFVPSCPRDYKMLWDGYSLMYTVGNGHAHSQDLGDAGSCSRSFSTLPFLFCEITGSCKYASRNDFVYWLSGDVRQPMMPVSNSAIEPFISRCIVCQAPSVHLAVHSQDVAKPECPTGWDSLWDGFSFMMVAGAGKTGAGQSLSSSGSCLETFRPKPFIECQGARGTCHFFSDKYSFWLTTINPLKQFEAQTPQTLSQTKGDVLETRVSRCKVCVRAKRGGGDGNKSENSFLRRFARNVKNYLTGN